MTAKPRFIAGDWGTSNLRLYLCEFDQSGSIILDTRFGVGVSQIHSDFEDRLFNLAQDWIDANPTAPVILSGMIGSTIGWKEAPYLTCPVNAKQIAEGRTQFKVRGTEFSILAGLRTTNPLGAPDIMRGEELQLLGWIRSSGAESGRHLFALPGTHNKWALSDRGLISNFLTAFTGELFALLRNHSILISQKDSFSFSEPAFIQAVDVIKNTGHTQFVHTLFATRAKQVLGQISEKDALSYLSGLIIGADILGAIELFEKHEQITIIGEPILTSHYSLALARLGKKAQCCDPADIAIAGFDAVYQEIYYPS